MIFSGEHSLRQRPPTFLPQRVLEEEKDSDRPQEHADTPSR